MKRLAIATAFFGAALLIAVSLSLGMAFVMALLWNATVSQAFGWPRIGVLTAWGIMFLVSIIGKCLHGSHKA